jgi:hypothetical protein
MMKLEGGWKDADHWGVYGPQKASRRDLPPQLKQMQPTGRRDEQGDEGRRRALEAATVARAEGDDWSIIAQHLRESPGAAAGPVLRAKERQVVEKLNAMGGASLASSSSYSRGSSSRPVPLKSVLLERSAFNPYAQEGIHRIMRTFPSLL